MPPKGEDSRAFGGVSPFARLVGLMGGTQIELEYIPGRDDALLWYGRKNKYGFNVWSSLIMNVASDTSVRVSLLLVKTRWSRTTPESFSFNFARRLTPVCRYINTHENPSPPRISSR